MRYPPTPSGAYSLRWSASGPSSTLRLRRRGAATTGARPRPSPGGGRWWTWGPSPFGSWWPTSRETGWRRSSGGRRSPGWAKDCGPGVDCCPRRRSGRRTRSRVSSPKLGRLEPSGILLAGTSATREAADGREFLFSLGAKLGVRCGGAVGARGGRVRLRRRHPRHRGRSSGARYRGRQHRTQPQERHQFRHGEPGHRGEQSDRALDQDGPSRTGGDRPGAAGGERHVRAPPVAVPRQDPRTGRLAVGPVESDAWWVWPGPSPRLPVWLPVWTATTARRCICAC